VPTREVRQRITTVGYAPPGIPALGRIKELLYPRRGVMQYLNGTVTGSYHVTPGRSFEVISEIPEFDDADLRRPARSRPRTPRRSTRSAPSWSTSSGPAATP
jgi:hypothetical protein